MDARQPSRFAAGPAPAQSPSGMVRVMPGAAIQPRRGRMAPLDSDERERALRVAERLHAELGKVVTTLPEAAQGGSAMARHLGIARNTCQRISHALQEPTPNLETLVRLPGVKGLEQFVEACRGIGVPEALAGLVEAALRDFSRLIDDLAGSHSKLIDRLTALDAITPDAGNDVAARAKLFTAAAELTGRHSRASVCMNLFRPIERGGEQKLERTSVNGILGSSLRPGGMPMVISSGDTLRWAHESDDRRLLDEAAVTGSTPTAILEEYTTTPLPHVTGRDREGELLQVIDPDHLDAETVVDVVTATRSSTPLYDPQSGKPALDQVWYLVNCAAEVLVFDVYLHVDLERQFRPSVDALLWYPNLSIPGGDRWINRFPGSTRLQLLGRGIDEAHTQYWPRHAHLTADIFNRLGWEPESFVGFRCEVEYPVWRAGYCMSFEQALPADNA